ncbi:AMP-binding protein [Bacillus sp. Brlt_9]|uniref:AMP-binding protein n=1 Tax=Bacillus sp. Brlt_9 TaxID=3110916 RepID=UPI003F7CB45B
MLPNKVNLYDEMKKQAKLHPKKIIIEDQNNSLTYEKFLITVNVLSKKIKEISLNEDRVGVYLPNVIGNIIVLFSMFKNEQSPCVLNFTMGTQSLLDCIETASLQTVLTSKEFIEAADLGTVVEEMEKKVKVIYLEDLKETISVAHKLIGLVEAKLPILTNKKQTDVVLFTSGTESKPKGVVLSHRNIFANIKQALAVIDATEEDKIFNALPLFHCFGLTVGAILPLVSNIKTFVYPSPLHYKEIPKYIKKDRSTILVGTNTFLDNYGRYSTREQLQSLRIVIAGAEKLKKDVQLKWKNEFGISILEGYGTTETSPIISLNTPQFTKEGTVGKIIPLLDYKIEPVEGISDGGSLLLKGPNVMQGYLIHGKGFVPCDEWYNTGDIVNIDKDGYIKIVARLKRFSKVAGEMVSLNKVEELALSCFGDSGFYAVSVPDTRKGERIILFTTSQGATEKELKKFIKQKKISSLYIPYKMEKIASVPLLGSGKPNYRELEDLAKTIKKGFFS